MATMLNDTIATAKNMMGTAKEGAEHAVDTAKNAVESAKEGTEHAVSGARSTLFDGIHAITGVVSMLRSLHADDALGWVGLARRRSPLLSIAMFGAGFAAGASAGVLFAPTSGAELRREILERLKGSKDKAKQALERAEAKAKALEHEAESVAGQAKDTLKKAERSVENKIADGAEALKEGVKSKVDAATGAVKDTLHDARSMISPSTDPAHQVRPGEANKPGRSQIEPGNGHRSG